MSESEALEEVQVVTITGEDGAEEYYEEAATLELDDKVFAILVPFHDEEEHDHCGCDCGCEDGEAIIARIDIIDGEPVYVAPTDEEFEQAAKAYDAMMEADVTE